MERLATTALSIAVRDVMTFATKCLETARADPVGKELHVTAVCDVENE